MTDDKQLTIGDGISGNFNWKDAKLVIDDRIQLMIDEAKAQGRNEGLRQAHQVLSDKWASTTQEHMDAILALIDTETAALEVTVQDSEKEEIVDTIEDIIGETHDIDVTDRRYAENIVAWLERHHPTALLALIDANTEEPK